MPGAAGDQLRTLEALGLTWDGPVLVQSTRTEAHREALDRLAREGRLYDCVCTRGDWTGPYPGTCRNRGYQADRDPPAAVRFALADTDPLDFVDRWQGARHYAPGALGDPVIWRRDGLVAYQLAVVVDDAHQGINDVVRGADLLDSTPWQRALQAALGLPLPSHAHVPLVTEPDGSKLAKSRHAIAVDVTRPGHALWQALRLLGQGPPASLADAPNPNVLGWALSNWSPARFRHRAHLAADGAENLGS